MVSCKPDADVAASVIAGSNLMALLENTHEGGFSFLFPNRSEKPYVTF